MQFMCLYELASHLLLPQLHVCQTQDTKLLKTLFTHKQGVSHIIFLGNNHYKNCIRQSICLLSCTEILFIYTHTHHTHVHTTHMYTPHTCMHYTTHVYTTYTHLHMHHTTHTQMHHKYARMHHTRSHAPHTLACTTHTYTCTQVRTTHTPTTHTLMNQNISWISTLSNYPN